MNQAFYTGLSGIKSNQYAIDVVSDNMANVSTTGFRGSEYEFASLYEDAIHTSHSITSSSVGIGTRVQATALKEAQGTLELSDRSTDIAILGDGWFGIQGADDPVYTRDGAFTFDANDDLVSLDGFYVLGTIGDNITDEILTKKVDSVALGDVATQEKLRFPKFLQYPSVPSTEAKYVGNLGEIGEVRTMSAGVIDPFSTKNTIQLTFKASDPQVQPGIQWDVVAIAKSIDGETIYDSKTGKVEFDETGALVTNTLTSINNNGAEVSIDLGTNFSGLVSITNSGVHASSSADGSIGGDLVGYTINKNAEVIATFTNGEQSSVGKIAVYHFQNDQGLARINGSKFQETSNSGRPLFYKNADGENILGTDVENFRLEGSNIDLTYGITELIILQRSYDANSKSITTSDEMMQKALSMDA